MDSRQDRAMSNPGEQSTKMHEGAVWAVARAMARYHDDTDGEDQLQWRNYFYEASSVLDAIGYDALVALAVNGQAFYDELVRRDGPEAPTLVKERDALTEERQHQEDELAIVRGHLRAVLDLPWTNTNTGMARVTTPDWDVIAKARVFLSELPQIDPNAPT